MLFHISSGDSRCLGGCNISEIDNLCAIRNRPSSEKKRSPPYLIYILIGPTWTLKNGKWSTCHPSRSWYSISKSPRTRVAHLLVSIHTEKERDREGKQYGIIIKRGCGNIVQHVHNHTYIQIANISIVIL